MRAMQYGIKKIRKHTHAHFQLINIDLALSQPYFDEWPPPFLPSTSALLPFAFTFHIIFYSAIFLLLPSTQIPFTYIIISACLSSIRHPPHLFRTHYSTKNKYTHATYEHKRPIHTRDSCQPYSESVNVLNFVQHGRWHWIEAKMTTKQINKTIQMIPIQLQIQISHAYINICHSACVYVCVCVPHVRHLLQ